MDLKMLLHKLQKPNRLGRVCVQLTSPSVWSPASKLPVELQMDGIIILFSIAPQGKIERNGPGNVNFGCSQVWCLPPG